MLPDSRGNASLISARRLLTNVSAIYERLRAHSRFATTLCLSVCDCTAHPKVDFRYVHQPETGTALDHHRAARHAHSKSPALIIRKPAFADRRPFLCSGILSCEL